MFIKTFGGCMRPLIKSGEVICIKQSSNVKVGDVVLYKFQDKNYLHRVVNIFEEFLFVSDDVGIGPLHKIEKKDIIGVYETIFSGKIGFVYNKIVKFLFLNLRKIKKWFI